MPQPFAWIDIPAGKVTLEAGGYVPVGGKTFAAPAFTIAKYPLTNAQFALFIAAKGYQQRRWWTEQGWQMREQENWLEPRFWQDEKWNQADYPVVGVSWHEAVAFCLWLSDVTEEAVMLPTEPQWQWAAQGNTHRAYPWGDEFDPTRCNSCVKMSRKKNSTSPVTKYEGKGDSPFGVVDMCGNVLEWCLTDFTNGLHDPNVDANSAYVTLRGGAWYVPSKHVLQNGFRFGAAPNVVDNGTGFRLARAFA